MPYSKSELQAFGDAIFGAGLAFSDGFQLTEDSPAILNVITRLMAAADEFKEDPVSAAMHVAARIADLAADQRRAQVPPEA